MTEHASQPRPFSYILCATPRSGSTLLAGLLTASDAGRPDSFFRTQDLADWAREWNVPAPPGSGSFGRPYLDAALAAGRSPSGVFGMRLMAETLPTLLSALERLFPDESGEPARLAAAFGNVRYIHLMRRDPLAQAVSLVRARQTGLWHRAPDGTEIERLAPPAPPRYDAAAIGATLDGLIAQAAAWLRWFARHRLDPLCVAYEDLAANPARTVATLLQDMGLPVPPPESLRPGVAQLADAVSAGWIARYRAETGM